jgi:hypothetical protein
MTEPREPDRTGQERQNTPGDWRGDWKQAADGTWYRNTPQAPRERPSQEARTSRHAARGGERVMTEPREPDRTGQERQNTPGDWRGDWKRAADGTWYRDTQQAPRKGPSRVASRREGASPNAVRQEDSAQPEAAQTEEAAPKRRRPRSKWVKIGFVTVAGLLVLALVRAIAGTGGHGGLSTSTAPLPAPQRPSTVMMGGVPVPTAGPVLTLNPGLVRQGAKVGVNGVGFDPGAYVDLQFLPTGGRPVPLPTVSVARDGSFAAGFTVPTLPNSPGGTVTAVQRGTAKGAQAQAVVQAGVGNASINRQAGRPGDVVAVSGGGFQPGELINAYWGRISGRPTAQLRADPSGGLTNVPVRVGLAQTGNATLVLVGDQSKTTATAGFTMIGLYPSATVSPYAVKAAQPFSVSGSGFVPGERVLVYVDRATGPPVTVMQSDQQGNVSGASFVAPFQLKGRQRLSMVGEQSRAVASSGFIIMPYTPTAQPSTWGGMPGTEMSFYASGFAPNEVVLVYAGRGHDSAGQLVSAFRVDEHGEASAAGDYTIPANAQGETSVQLVGRQSGGVANVTLSVEPGGGGAEMPPTAPYVLPPDLAQDPLVPGGPPPPPPAPPGPPGPPAQPRPR